jgi:hypothetical protein
MTDQSKRERATAALAEHGTVRAAARALGIPPSTFQGWQASHTSRAFDKIAEGLSEVLEIVAPKGRLRPPEREIMPVTAQTHCVVCNAPSLDALCAACDKPKGRLRPPEREIMPLPRKGQVKTYIVSSAQNNTALHSAAWQNLLALAAHENAEVLVASFTYKTNGRAAEGQKKTSREGGDDAEWWDARVIPYLRNASIRLAPGLVWCGEMQILPTAVRPLSGLESHTGRDSAIIPHVKFAIEPVAVPKGADPKFLYTTGTVTLRNYIEKKAGQKASFHHGYGGLIVEVCDDGVWFVRILNADSEGTIYDLDRKVENGVVTRGHRPEAIVWGDIHTRHLERALRKLAWGAGGILDQLQPQVQVMHDVLDFRSQNHHDRKDPWRVFEKHVAAALNVGDEIAELADFLDESLRDYCQTVVAAANHDEALIRWAKESDFREDPENAEFLLDLTAAAYRAMRLGNGSFYPVEWAVRRETAWCGDRMRFLRRDETFVVCEDAQGGIKLDMHGDIGPNGARGNVKQFARTGQKCIVAHAHSLALHDGALQVPLMGALRQGYNVGMSSWSHGFGMVYQNGKRSPVTIRGGRWHARSVAYGSTT